MSNSSLVKVTRISPNKTKRTKKITKITPHHCAGVMTAEQILAVFTPASRQASANYVIGNDGKIGLCVPENYRAWTSSNWDNDQSAVTIEVSNSSVGGQWPVSDKAWNALVDLCVDICKRNGIKALSWTGKKDGSLTCHYMFMPTACPGPYLKSRMGKLASAVNAKLNTKPASTNKIPITGAWGKQTTTALQKILKTPVTGNIGGQTAKNFNKVNQGGLLITSWKTGRGGSEVIRALQKKLGLGSNTDGQFGPNTCKALQKYLGTYVDGKVDNPSEMVKALQRKLNTGKF